MNEKSFLDPGLAPVAITKSANKAEEDKYR